MVHWNWQISRKEPTLQLRIWEKNWDLILARYYETSINALNYITKTETTSTPSSGYFSFLQLWLWKNYRYHEIIPFYWGPVRGKFRQATWPWTGDMKATNWRRPTDYCNELAKATPMSRLSDSEFGNWQNCECPAEHLRVHYSVVATE